MALKNKEILEKLTAMFSKETETEPTMTIEDLAKQMQVIGESLLNFDERLTSQETPVAEEVAEEVAEVIEEVVAEEEVIVEETVVEEIVAEETVVEVAEEVAEVVPTELEIAMAKITELETKMVELSKAPSTTPVINDETDPKPVTFAEIRMAADKRRRENR